MLLAYTTLTETLLVAGADVLRLNVALRWATPKLEAAYAAISGLPQLAWVRARRAGSCRQARLVWA